MPAAATACSPRDRLLDAATELFATRGYQAIGLRDLASHLGLRAGSLYHHIENKQCLLFELIESTLADLVFDTKRCMKGARTPKNACSASSRRLCGSTWHTPIACNW
ncbi:TetR/AcrR family transcriptional regulator [Pseudomonas qingdaonensis]|nr:TetR/AcrR family transcriptional regulator [Pseudomonas qingdaonensis]